MSITYSFDPNEKLIIEDWTGEVTADDLAAHWRIYLADRRVMALRRTLVDLRDAQICFNGSQLKVLIEDIVLPVLQTDDWKTAIVVKRSIEYGISKQYQLFADSYSKDAVFFDIDRARDWLMYIPE